MKHKKEIMKEEEDEEIWRKTDLKRKNKIREESRSEKHKLKHLI